jgi:hypothetical protein
MEIYGEIGWKMGWVSELGLQDAICKLHGDDASPYPAT